MEPMKRRDAAYLIGLLLALGVLVFHHLPEYSYSWDSHNKLVQSWSLLQNSFQSDELYYYYSESDPEYRFFPHIGASYGKLNDEFVSAFPLALATMAAPILSLVGPAGLVAVFAVFLFLCTVLLHRYWNFRGAWVFIPAATTFLIMFALEFNEHLLVAFLSMLGLTIWLKDVTNKRNALIGGAVLGLAAFFRHETFPLLLAAGLAGLIVFRRSIELANPATGRSASRKSRGEHHVAGKSTRAAEENPVPPVSKPAGKTTGGGPLPAGRSSAGVAALWQNWKEAGLLHFTIGATGSVLAFLLFNLVTSGHLLGPRFIFNSEGLAVELSTRLQWSVDLLIWHQFKPGLFGYIPAFAVVLLAGFIHYRKLEDTFRFLLWTVTFAIPLILAIVPNNGIQDWGPRYFGMLLLPALAIARELWKSVSWQRTFRIAVVALSVVPLLLSVFGPRYMRSSREVNRTIINELQSRNAKLWVFAGIGTMYSSSAEYLHRPILVIKHRQDFEPMIDMLARTDAGQRVLFIGLKEDFQPALAEEQQSEAGELKDINSFSQAAKDQLRSSLDDFQQGTAGPYLEYMEGTIR